MVLNPEAKGRENFFLQKILKNIKVPVLNTAAVRLYVGTWHSQVPDKKQGERQSGTSFLHPQPNVWCKTPGRVHGSTQT